MRTFQDYQERALKLSVYGSGDAIIYPTLGLTGKAGEVADKVKKVLRDKAGDFDFETRQAIAKELGDVLWYITALARDIDYDLVEIARLNLYKLESRQARGVQGGSGDDR